MMNLILATTNRHKLFEVREALPAWEIESQPAHVPYVEESGTTFEANAIIKAVHASHYVDGMVLADDSGLCVEALDGRPGVYSARYAPGDDAARIQKVLDEMRSVPDANRQAAFVCALAVAQRGKVLWTGEGRVEGYINRVPAGTDGFGYDPIFWIPEFERTMAELTIEEKNQTSHRGRALHEFVRHFAGSGRL